jgi:type II secretory pathway component PulJ
MRRSRSAPDGYALIEIVLAIGAVAIVLGMCAGMLHVLLRLDRTGRSHVVETAAIGRLSRQFRQDVHAAREARALADGASLELRLPGESTVTYSLGTLAVARSAQQDMSPERRETYTLPLLREARFEVQDRDSQTWVRLKLRLGPARDSLELAALAGRDKVRWDRLAKESEVTP